MLNVVRILDIIGTFERMDPSCQRRTSTDSNSQPYWLKVELMPHRSSNLVRFGLTKDFDENF